MMNSQRLSRAGWGGAIGILAIWPVLAFAAGAERAPLKDLVVPGGFHVGIYADGLGGPRSMALGADGTVFVACRASGQVIALRGLDGQGRAEQRLEIAKGLDQPNGVATGKGDLFVAEISRILRFPGLGEHLAPPPGPSVVRDDLPTETHHGLRYLGFGPDGKLYVAIGAPCNVCEPAKFDRRGASLEYGTITRMNPDGSAWHVVARGIRNSVGFGWPSAGNKLWFTNNGRDLLGDDLPSDTLNRLDSVGADFGFPYCHQGNLLDPEFGAGHSCAGFAAPAFLLGAHVASLGMRFYSGHGFPAHWRDSIFIAEHGSWNRSRKVGYRVVAVHIVDGRAVSQEPFIEGWLQDEAVSGRPVDVLFAQDGALLVSDDLGGRIYRVTADP